MFFGGIAPRPLSSQVANQRTAEALQLFKRKFLDLLKLKPPRGTATAKLCAPYNILNTRVSSANLEPCSSHKQLFYVSNACWLFNEREQCHFSGKLITFPLHNKCWIIVATKGHDFVTRHHHCHQQKVVFSINKSGQWQCLHRKKSVYITTSWGKRVYPSGMRPRFATVSSSSVFRTERSAMWSKFQINNSDMWGKANAACPLFQRYRSDQKCQPTSTGIVQHLYSRHYDFIISSARKKTAPFYGLCQILSDVDS